MSTKLKSTWHIVFMIFMVWGKHSKSFCSKLENLPKEVWNMHKWSWSKLLTTALHWKWKKRAASDARLLLTSSFDSALCFLLLAMLTPYIFIYLIKITLVSYVMQPSESLYLIPRNAKVCYLHCQSGYLYLDCRSSCHLSSSSRMPISSWSCSVCSPTYHLPDGTSLRWWHVLLLTI